mmetsp:Transcript_15107/g.32091  ORF Transcript_15107/g.32091 Transcript_15107/m.32091 type:complete len:714 (+) Transcript_15107:902-3043(+)
MAAPPLLRAMIFITLSHLVQAGLLHPQDSESRETKQLGGLWRFRADFDGEGYAQKWQATLPEPTLQMPVPCSYNDLTQDVRLRDMVGVVWYERDFFLPLRWLTQRVVLYVGSAQYSAQVWINGAPVGAHEGGHLPFHLPLEPFNLNFGKTNRLTIAVNNTLTPTTLPAGYVQINAAGRRVQRLQMDFFNYAGIQRQVMIYTTPQSYLDDVSVTTRLEGKEAFLNVFVSAVASNTVLITLFDEAGNVVARGRMPADPRRGGKLNIQDPQLWWPRYMSERPGYLYTIQVEVLGADGNVSDVYRFPYGIRTVSVANDQGLLINGQPFYFHGFGKHEDNDIRGRGLDLPSLVKDFSLLEWMGANSIRTTHYPYSEDFMNMCDRLGIVVINEAPAVGLQGHNMVRETLVRHMQVLTELIGRDKNHPSVVMWSIANEPDSESPAAAPYFKHVAAHARSLDPSRPITFATFKSPDKDVVAPFVDVLMINRYHAWYTNTGQIDIIEPTIERDLISWYRRFRKPIMISEYGADAVAGLHADPPYAFTEEFQSEYISKYFSTFDKLRSVRVFIGEQVWTFSDFMTAQGVTRVYGNKKGLFTRQRQPKMAAYRLKERYERISNSTRRYPTALADMAWAAMLPINAGSTDRAAQPPDGADGQRGMRGVGAAQDTAAAAEAAAVEVVEAAAAEAAAAAAAAAEGGGGSDSMDPLDESGMGPTHVWQ